MINLKINNFAMDDILIIDPGKSTLHPSYNAVTLIEAHPAVHGANDAESDGEKAIFVLLYTMLVIIIMTAATIIIIINIRRRRSQQRARLLYQIRQNPPPL